MLQKNWQTIVRRGQPAAATVHVRNEVGLRNGSTINATALLRSWSKALLQLVRTILFLAVAIIMLNVMPWFLMPLGAFGAQVRAHISPFGSGWLLMASAGTSLFAIGKDCAEDAWVDSVRFSKVVSRAVTVAAQEMINELVGIVASCPLLQLQKYKCVRVSTVCFVSFFFRVGHWNLRSFREAKAAWTAWLPPITSVVLFCAGLALLFHFTGAPLGDGGGHPRARRSVAALACVRKPTVRRPGRRGQVLARSLRGLHGRCRGVHQAALLRA